MEFKKGQVKILKSPETGREAFVNLEDVVLFPNTENEISLGRYLLKLSQNDEKKTEEISKLKTAIRNLADTISKLNKK